LDSISCSQSDHLPRQARDKHTRSTKVNRILARAEAEPRARGSAEGQRDYAVALISAVRFGHMTSLSSKMLFDLISLSTTHIILVSYPSILADDVGTPCGLPQEAQVEEC
jgi:hypothetical protein